MDRRKSDRVKPIKQQQITLQILDLTLDVKPENISPGGIFLTAGVSLPANMLLEIVLSYVDTSATCLARVQHRYGYGVGIEFINPSEAFRELIDVANELSDQAPEPMNAGQFDRRGIGT